MDIYKLRFTSLQTEIFRLLCVKTGMEINQRHLAEFLKVSPTAIGNSLPMLEKEGIVKVTRGRTKLNLVSLNRDSQNTLELKRAENLRMLYESGLPGFLEEHLPGATIVLFGSYAKGDDTTKSDIDIAAIGVNDKRLDIAKFEKQFEKEIRINYYKSQKELDKLFLSSICNGIVLSGGIEL